MNRAQGHSVGFPSGRIPAHDRPGLTYRWPLVLVAFCLFMGAVPQARATDSNPVASEVSPDPAKVVEPFAQVKSEWDALEKKLADLVEQFREVPPEQREPLRKTYLELVEKSSSVLGRLRQSAIAEYRATGNDNKEVSRFLVALLNNDLKIDNYLAALELARLLLDQQHPEKSLLAKAGIAAFGANEFDLAEKYLKQAAEAEALEPADEALLAELPEIKTAWAREREIRSREKTADDLPRVKLTTNKGVLIVELFENEAPQTVANFISLVEKKYYDGLTFHRVLGGFMAQAGCPKGDGTGGPGYQIYCECARPDSRNHFAGTLSMAHEGKNSAGSQFSLTFRPAPELDDKHTAFGRVVEGMDVLPRLQRRDPQRGGDEADRILKAEILRKRDHKYEPTKVTKP